MVRNPIEIKEHPSAVSIRFQHLKTGMVPIISIPIIPRQTKMAMIKTKLQVQNRKLFLVCMKFPIQLCYDTPLRQIHVDV